MKNFFLDAVRLYLESGILLAAAAIFTAFFLCLPTSAAGRLRAVQTLLVACLLLPLAMACLPSRSLWPPRAQVWSGENVLAGGGYALVALPAAASPRTPAIEGWRVSDRVTTFAGIFWVLVVLAGGIRLFYRRLQLGRFLLRQTPRRSLGRVRVLFSTECTVAFSATYRGLAFVVLPASLRRVAARITLAHELQHHRQGDTRLVGWLEAIKVLFFWNPGGYFLVRALGHLQEFACDEKLVGHRRFSAQAYGRCLLEAAQTALSSDPLPFGTKGMAVSNAGRFLKRRITMILKPAAPRRWFGFTAVGTLLLMAALSFAAHSAVQNRTLSEKTALEAAQRAAMGSLIPIDMNDLVLESLRHFATTPEGRKHIQGALNRMPLYQAMIERKMAQYRLPQELMAVPMYESGFLNDRVSSALAAGIWQFVPGTARRYNLKAVDKKADITAQNDDRINPEKETDAAMRYLSDLHTRFKDWRLAIKAYNEGEERVEQLIQETASRDPWVLERASSTEGYLSGAIATLILYKNPQLLN